MTFDVFSLISSGLIRIAQEYLASMQTIADSSSDSHSDDGQVPGSLHGNEKITHKLTQARLENQGKYFR